MYDETVRELDDLLLDRQQEDIIEQMKEMGEIEDYNTGGRVGLQGGGGAGGGGGGDAGGAGGGGDIQLRRAEARRKEMQALKGGDYSNEDLLYNWLSGSPGTQYREEFFRDPQWTSWQKERPTQGMADAEDYKRMIIEAGDPRGLFSGNITNTRYQSPGEIDASNKYLSHFNRMTSVLGMDPSTMASGAQSNLQGNVAPWATTAQQDQINNATTANTGTTQVANTNNTLANTNNTLGTGALGGGGWKPFMTDEESQNYYGQFANGGPVALRRKMFSMGGNVDKAHGVGITSGLTKTVPPQRGPMPQGYKTGGHVIPRAKFGWGGEVFKRIMKFVDPRPSSIKSGKEVTEKVMGTGDDVAHPLLGGSDEGILKEVLKIKDPTKKMMALRALATWGGGAGVLSSALLPEADPSAAESPLGAAGAWLQKGVEATTALNPLLQAVNIGKNLHEASKPYGEGDFSWTPAGMIRDWRDKSGADIVEESGEGESEVAEIVDKMTQEEILKDEYQKKLDLYKDLLGQGNEGENNWGTLGDALMAGGTALTEGKGWGGGLSAFHEPLSAEMALRRQRAENINQAAATQAMTEMYSRDQTNQAADAEAMLAGEWGFPGVREEMQNASRNGITQMVPVNEGGEWDQAATASQPGTVFINPEKTAGSKFYVAVNQSGVIESFNNVEEALAWAESR